MATSTADRGKEAEKLVQDALKLYGERYKGFDFERHYDAHSAGGVFQKVTGDFAWFQKLNEGQRFGIIEVKEVRHSFRLPYKNLDSGQAGKILKRKWAGGICFVLVRHMPEDLWRVVDIDGFSWRNPSKPSGSWDLSAYPLFGSAEASLASVIGPL